MGRRDEWKIYEGSMNTARRGIGNDREREVVRQERMKERGERERKRGIEREGERERERKREREREREKERDREIKKEKERVGCEIRGRG